jgi:hypothetical protein
MVEKESIRARYNDDGKGVTFRFSKRTGSLQTLPFSVFVIVYQLQGMLDRMLIPPVVMPDNDIGWARKFLLKPPE